MIKKLVSNALLSIVMDKKAREKYNAVKEAKRLEREDHPLPDRANASPTQLTESTIPTSTPGRAPEFSSSPPRADDDDPEALIREALESAELELIEKRNKKPMTSERQALIDQAMAIHNSKSHILDELDPEHREKLTFMALKALDKNFGE